MKKSFEERKIESAREFVRLGFGEFIDDAAAFGSDSFLTDELTTWEAKEVVAVLREYNAFNGENVAIELEQFHGQVQSWRFGSEDSPVLYVEIPYWTQQAELSSSNLSEGRLITPKERANLVKKIKFVFQKKLSADEVTQDKLEKNKYRIWWD